MPEKKQWRPMMTAQLRRLVKELEFVAIGTTSDGKQVIYTNKARNAYAKVLIPIDNYANVNLYKRVISDLVDKFHYSKEEIVEAGEKLPKVDMISSIK